MVHIVKKKIKNKTYLYLQRSIYNKKTKRRSTEHVAYLGRCDLLSDKEIKEIVDDICH